MVASRYTLLSSNGSPAKRSDVMRLNGGRFEPALQLTVRTGISPRAALRDRPFIIFLLATLCITLVDFQMGSSFALHVKTLGFPSRAYGVLISMNGMLIVAFELFLTQWTRIWSKGCQEANGVPGSAFESRSASQRSTDAPTSANGPS